jgi:hypothetical protein
MDFLTLLPPGLRPYAKAVTPAALAVLAAIVRAITAGAVAAPELEVALVGLLAASATFAVDQVPAGWRAYAKAIVPAALTVVAVPIHLLVTGSWDQAEWTLAITGLGAAAVALLVPNEGGAGAAAVAGASAGDGVAPASVPLLATEDAAALAAARERAAAANPPLRPEDAA